MKIKKISYPTAPDNGVDIYDDNIDVFVELDSGDVYTLTVCTPQHHYSYMDKENTDFIPAAPPDVIVRELRHEIIEKAIQSFCADDAYFLKCYAKM